MPNSRICVALMVSSPIYVAQMLMANLRDPDNKIGAFGWGVIRQFKCTRPKCNIRLSTEQITYCYERFSTNLWFANDNM